MDDNETTIKCGCYLLVLLCNLIFGAMSVNYLLEIFLNKTIPFLGALIIGMVAGQFTIPTAIIIWVLKYFNVF